MPPQPTWLLQVPHILTQLRALQIPVLDRASVETLFGVKRWQAIQLAHRFGGYQTGKTFLVDRLALIGQLDEIAAGETLAYQQRRRERVVAALDKARRYRQAAAVKIPLRPGAPYRIEGLAQGIELRPRKLTVEFAGAEDLLSKLYELAQTVAQDFERFRAAVEGPPPNDP